MLLAPARLSGWESEELVTGQLCGGVLCGDLVPCSLQRRRPPPPGCLHTCRVPVKQSSVWTSLTVFSHMESTGLMSLFKKRLETGPQPFTAPASSGVTLPVLSWSSPCVRGAHGAHRQGLRGL